MSKVKRALGEFKPDIRLVDERGPTKERMHNVDLEVGDIGTITVRQSPVERLLKRGQLSEKQGQAAQKLYLHWYRAGMGGRLGGFSPERVSGLNPLREAEYTEFHANRLHAGVRSVHQRMEAAGYSGLDAVRVLEYVICRETTLEAAGLAIGWRSWEAKAMAASYLRGGLNILVKEWGL